MSAADPLLPALPGEPAPSSWPGCMTHPLAPAEGPCAGCARPYCANCLVEIMGRRLCAECKARVVGSVEQRKPQHPYALWAVLVPLIGYFTVCLVPVLCPIGIYLGHRVVREVDEDPRLSGRSAGLAGMVLGAALLANFLLAGLAVLVLRFGR